MLRYGRPTAGGLLLSALMFTGQVRSQTVHPSPALFWHQPFCHLYLLLPGFPLLYRLHVAQFLVRWFPALHHQGLEEQGALLVLHITGMRLRSLLPRLLRLLL